MIVSVEFEGTPNKLYFFKTDLPLIKNGIYNIVADNHTVYDNRVKVMETNIPNVKSLVKLRTITDATLLWVPSVPRKYKNIYVSYEKKTVCIVWNDGSKTKMKPQPGEEFDVEKGIALCFMKKLYNNRGCFNNAFRDITVVGKEE